MLPSEPGSAGSGDKRTIALDHPRAHGETRYAPFTSATCARTKQRRRSFVIAPEQWLGAPPSPDGGE